ncbi:MAG: hypothetical protein KAJ19_22275 [Gammaproteobacteria bacterium]|nr:hypothetical protein [Gammaproteobacteria bacterium]
MLKLLRSLIAEVVNEEIDRRKPEIIKDLKLEAELELIDRLREVYERSKPG